MDVNAATVPSCFDPLNVQSRTDSASSSSGVVTCGSANTGCGVIFKLLFKLLFEYCYFFPKINKRIISGTNFGSGICLGAAATSPTSSLVYSGTTYDSSGALTFTSASNYISSCWNPSANQAAFNSPAISTSSPVVVILACYVSNN